ncbi:unnamed protein product [Ceutorhynchus assimilis]|uniref:Uncharacterized protein n=1 Tax=Ceutorhynchus assimilis TaxID=467358 RepID=A0A9N9MDQ3_9CUCU|nr:unnamed protein product [Ceutorhynchus assimilis]
MKYLHALALIICVIKLNQCLPYDSSVISKYSKVALWGNNSTDSSEARDTESKNTWNHRLNPKSISMNTKNTPSVAYQYPVYQKPEEKIDQHIEHVDGIGEVIVKQAQDRFEARPLFAYRNKLSDVYGTPSASKKPVVPAPGAAPTTAPLSLSAPSLSDPYNSPYTSYNPPKFNQDNSDTISNLYAPNEPNKGDSINSPTSDTGTKDLGPSTETVKTIPDSYASLGPPLAPSKPANQIDYSNHDYHDHDSYEHHGYQDHYPPQDSMAMYKYNNEAPDHPPKSLDDVYYPSDFPKDQIPGQGMMNPDMGPDAQHQGDESDDASMVPQGDQMIPQGDQIIKPDMMDQGKSNDDSPSHDYGDYKFPKYLYDHDLNHHHVYEEIPHPTMAPAKEDKRVSSTHYSYYYLGRKLWYIPLYFSVYFIIYVTVLILKSIARHKVRLKYKWYEHDTSAKQARSMDLISSRLEETTNLHHNVLTAIQNVTDKYKGLAM